jgi:small GTP-binding protein
MKMKINYEKIFDEAYEQRKPDFSKTLNIAVVGKVSGGKSSLINAIFERNRENAIAKVGAISGVTTKVKSFRLDERVLLIDCPGLDDVKDENSEITESFLKSIDIGIFVVTGSSDASQKTNYEKLKENCKKTFVVLNQIDTWDDLKKEAVDDVINQWKKSLGCKKIYPTNTKGYDPESREDAPLDIRGVDALKEDITDFLKKEGKDLLFLKNLQEKEGSANKIILAALVAVAAEAFIPGSAAYITATQTVAITALHYLYTGEVISKKGALALIPTFIGESIGTTVFLWLKSFLPPTGIIDAAAAVVAVTITFAMLYAIKSALKNNISLDDKDYLLEIFSTLKKISPKDIDIKKPEKIFQMADNLVKA